MFEMKLVPCDPPCGLHECPKCHSHRFTDHGPFTETVAVDFATGDVKLAPVSARRIECAQCGHIYPYNAAR